MHALVFGTKRVHHGFLAWQRQLLKGLGITPARVELLIVMAFCGMGPEKMMRQECIWAELGVRKSTTCRMLAAMEKDEWVVRSPAWGGKHSRSVHITQKARRLLVKVDQLFFRFQLALLVTFRDCSELMFQMRDAIERLRKRLDRSNFSLLWSFRLRKRLPTIPKPIAEVWRNFGVARIRGYDRR